MTHNKPSKEEGYALFLFFFFCFMQGHPQYAYATTRGGIRQKLHKNQRRKEDFTNESNKEFKTEA